MAKRIITTAASVAAAGMAFVSAASAQVVGQSAIGDGSRPTTVQTQTTAPATATVAWRCGRDARNPALQICDNNFGETVRVGADEAMRLQGSTQGRGYTYEARMEGRRYEAELANDIHAEQVAIAVRGEEAMTDIVYEQNDRARSDLRLAGQQNRFAERNCDYSTDAYRDASRESERYYRNVTRGNQTSTETAVAAVFGFPRLLGARQGIREGSKFAELCKRTPTGIPAEAARRLNLK